MPCFHPLKGWYSRSRNPKTGLRSVVFSKSLGLVDRPVTVPCGHCLGCYLDRTQQWGLRCFHESQLYSKNCFITLTYDDAHLHPDGSLDPRDFVLFMKRLRKRFPGVDPVIFNGKETFPIRFFHCGEYGENFERPHHHACVFNFDFPDKRFFQIKNGNTFYTSEILQKMWGKGYCIIGDVTMESAAYVARYIMKKLKHDDSDEHYANDDGVVRYPEYVTMSRCPGIATGWFEKYGKQVYPADAVTLPGGIKRKPPRFYDKLFDLLNPKLFAKIRQARVSRALELSEDNGPDRLLVKEKVATARLGQLKRGFENE